MTEDYRRINEKAYDSLANHYRSLRRGREALVREVAKPFVKYIKSRVPRPRVLEVGPGSGMFLEEFNRLGFVTTAIDISEEMLEAARELAPETNLIKGDYLQYDFGDKKFDGIFARSVIHLFPRADAVEFLRKTGVLLEENGVAHVCTRVYPNSSEGYVARSGGNSDLIRYKRCWSEKDLLEAVGEAGLDVSSRAYYGGIRGEKGISLVLVSR